MLDAVIFDMDGVVIESESHWHKVEDEFLRGVVKEWTDADQNRILGRSIYDIYALLVDEYGLMDTKEQFLAHYGSLAATIYSERASLVDGAFDLIQLLFEEGVCLALASSAPHQWISLVLDRFGLGRFFSVVVSSDDVGGVGKPAPDIYRFALKALQAKRDTSEFFSAMEPLASERCVAIEDSDRGVLSAKQAGLRCIAYRGYSSLPQQFDGADMIVGSLLDLELVTFNRLVGATAP